VFLTVTLGGFWAIQRAIFCKKSISGSIEYTLKTVKGLQTPGAGLKAASKLLPAGIGFFQKTQISQFDCASCCSHIRLRQSLGPRCGAYISMIKALTKKFRKGGNYDGT
jgi:hypothetical protein